MITKSTIFLLVLGGHLMGAGGAEGQVEPRDLASTSLTIHSENFAVIRDRIELDIPAGGGAFSYDGATSNLEPTSVILLSSGGEEMKIKEQSYRNDVLNTSYLLSLFEGQSIDFMHESGDGTRTIFGGRVVRSGHGGGEPIIQVGGKMRFGLPGVPLFPDLGSDTLLKPRLEWEIDSPEGYRGLATVSYLSGGMGWQASYNLVIPDKGKGGLSGWVSINNSTGRDFLQADVNLLAGEVKRDLGGVDKMYSEAVLYEAPTGGARAVARKAFDEYHLYSLPDAIRLRDRETKQIEFLNTQAVDVKTTYKLVFQSSGGLDSEEGVAGKIEVGRSFVNNSANGLGVPLPQGIFRVYKLDGAEPEFLGESRIDHTPENETVDIVTGYAFDITAKKNRTNREDRGQNYLGGRTIVESYQITINNRKKEQVTIAVLETMPGINWSISESSHSWKKTGGQEIRWDLDLEPESSLILTYTVVYRG